MVSVGMNYYTDNRANEQPGMGRIARYAWGKDYHTVMSQRLSQLEAKIAALAPGVTTRAYVDTGPIMEKAWAQQAGLGWIGKHSNLVSAECGSWLLLGEILTTLDLEQDEPATDLCGSCTLCIQACPTGAIVEPYVVDARLCISYLTIELRGGREVISDELAAQMGNRIFGCDDCLDVCPFNLRADATSEPAFTPTPLTLAPSLQALAQISEESFATTFKESPLKRAKQSGLLRNVGIAQENHRRQTGGRASISLTPFFLGRKRSRLFPVLGGSREASNPMHPPILLLISTDPHARPLLEQALDHRSATILAASNDRRGSAHPERPSRPRTRPL